MLAAFLSNAANNTNIENGARFLIGALKRHTIDFVKVGVVYRQRQSLIPGILRVSLMTLPRNLFSHDI
jgi:hypothetical protein